MSSMYDGTIYPHLYILLKPLLLARLCIYLGYLVVNSVWVSVQVRILNLKLLYFYLSPLFHLLWLIHFFLLFSLPLTILLSLYTAKSIFFTTSLFLSFSLYPFPLFQLGIVSLCLPAVSTSYLYFSHSLSFSFFVSPLSLSFLLFSFSFHPQLPLSLIIYFSLSFFCLLLTSSSVFFSDCLL